MGRASVEPGDLVAEKFRVEHVIGRGGMGLVLAATDVKLGRRVALKCLLPHAWGNAAAVARFDREARASVALESEHVCRVLDVGRMPDGAPFIAMELLEGMDLAHELHRRGGRLPIVEAASYVVQACDAIAEAHTRGIIHRDLKPSNLFLHKRAGRDSIIKVLDFGISKPTALGDAPSALTGTADLLGSPLYMSPEQLRAPKTVDARSDIWSLAATLYELVTGKPPFEGTTIADLATSIVSAPAPDVRQRVPNAPPAFAAIIVRALAKSRDERFASADELARALAPFASASKTVPMAAIVPPASSTKLLSAPATPRSTPRDVTRALPLAHAPTAARAVPPSDPRLSGAIDAEPPLPPPVRSLSAPLAIGGALVAAVAVVIVVVTMRAKDDATAASADASASAAPSAIAMTAPRVASAPSHAPSAVAVAVDADADADAAATSASAVELRPDAAAVAPAPPPPSPPPAPRPAPSSLPDARAFESAGY